MHHRQGSIVYFYFILFGIVELFAYGFWGGSIFVYLVQSILHVKPFFERGQEVTELLKIEARIESAINSQKLRSHVKALELFSRHIVDVARRMQSEAAEQQKQSAMQSSTSSSSSSSSSAPLQQSRVVELD